MTIQQFLHRLRTEVVVVLLEGDSELQKLGEELLSEIEEFERELEEEQPEELRIDCGRF